MSVATEIDRVHGLVDPIASDLDLDVYDIERRGATIRIMLDTYPGADGGITLDSLALATRLISRELDHEDPIAGHYTLEVSSPGLERPLRTPAHFRREVGKVISIRLSDPQADPRRLEGLLVGADERTATVRLDGGGSTDGDGTDRVIAFGDIDKARTVFDWGPQPKPGKGTKNAKKSGTSKQSASRQRAEKPHTENNSYIENTSTSTKEKQSS